MDDNETIRWPANLDRAAIEDRLIQVRNAARGKSLPELVSLLDGVETKPAAQLAAAVIGALAWVEGKGHGTIEKQLQMVALNLKNLK